MRKSTVDSSMEKIFSTDKRMHSCTISVAVSIIFIIALIMFLIVYIRDKELNQERPKEDNNWIIGFLVILVVGFIGSATVAYRSYTSSTLLRTKRAFI